MSMGKAADGGSQRLTWMLTATQREQDCSNGFYIDFLGTGFDKEMVPTAAAHMEK